VLRESLAGLGPATLIRRSAELPDPAPEASKVDRTVVFTLRTLASGVLALKALAHQLGKRLRELVAAQAPRLCSNAAGYLARQRRGAAHRRRGQPAAAARRGFLPPPLRR
jgi:hypothetical protein